MQMSWNTAPKKRPYRRRLSRKVGSGTSGGERSRSPGISLLQVHKSLVATFLLGQGPELPCFGDPEPCAKMKTTCADTRRGPGADRRLEMERAAGSGTGQCAAARKSSKQPQGGLRVQILQFRIPTLGLKGEKKADNIIVNK